MIEVALLLAVLGAIFIPAAMIGAGVALGIFLHVRARQGVDELEAAAHPSR